MKKYLNYFIIVILELIILNSLNCQTVNKWEIVDSSKIKYFKLTSTKNIDYYDENDIVVIGDAVYYDVQKIKTNLSITKFIDKGTKAQNIYLDTIHTTDVWTSISHPSKEFIIVTGDSLGWLGNFNGNKYLYFALLIKSTDGGKTWQRKIYDSNTVFKDISMCDSLNGIIFQAGYSNYFNPNTQNKKDSLLITDNGWKSFKKIALPFKNNSIYHSRIYCPFKNVFAVISYDANEKKQFVYISKDGGQTWEESSYFDLKVRIYDMKFINKNIVFAVGSRQFTSFVGSEEPLIFQSFDGGFSWQQSQNIFNNINDINKLRSVDFSDDKNGIASGKFSYYRTTNGGKKWTKEYNPSNLINKIYHTITQVIFPNKEFAFASLERNYLLRCNNKKNLKAPKFYYILNANYQNINNINVKWSSIQGANKYHLKIDGVSRDSSNFNFNNPLIDTTLADTSIILNNLNYYYHFTGWVKAIDNNIESDWTKSSNIFKTIYKKNQLIPPGLIYPSYNEIIAPTVINLLWQKIPDAISYNIKILNFINQKTLISLKNIEDTSVQISGIEHSQEYEVWLQSVNSNEVSNNSYSYFYTSSEIIEVKEDVWGDYNLFIYPNPTKEKINLRINSSIFSNVTINIYNILGLKINSLTTELARGENDIPINTFDLPKGLYFVKVLTGDKISKGMFIKN